MSNKLYVGNIPFKTTEDDLREAFAPFGELTDVYIAMDRMSGRPRGFAFVSYNTNEEAAVAAEKMNGFEMGDRPLVVNTARPKEEGGNRSFGGGGGGRGRGFGGGGGGGRGRGFGGGGGRGGNRGGYNRERSEDRY